MRAALCAIAVAGLFSGTVLCQSEPEPENVEQESGIVVQLPASVSRSTLTANGIGEIRRLREWGGEVWVESECDDNPLLAAARHVSDCGLSIRPKISFTSESVRTTFNVLSGGTYNRHRKLALLDNSEQWGRLDLRHAFTKRFAVRIQQFTEHRNLAGQALSSGNGLDLGLMQGLNPLIITPAVDRTTIDFAAQTTYRPTERSLLGITTTYSSVRYGRDGELTVQLPKTRLGTSSLLYSRLVSRHQWAGLQYTFQHMRWGTGPWEGTHSFLYTHTVALRSWMTFGAFVGPEYSARHGSADDMLLRLLSHVRSKWLVAGGASFGLGTKRTSFGISFVRRVTDGGGVTGSAVMNGAIVGVRRRVTARLTLDMNTKFGKTEPLYTPQTVDTIQTDASVEYRFGQHVLTQVRYGSDWERFPHVTPSESLRRNRVAIAIGYRFGGPIGR